MPGTPTYERLRSDIADTPVIDCHEHSGGPSEAPKYNDGLVSLISGYVQSDLRSASCDADIDFMYDASKPLDERWPVFERAWRQTEHTGYARVTKWILREIYDEPEMTREAVERISGRIIELTDEGVYWGILDKAGIRCRLQNIWPDPKAYLDGTYTLPERDRFMIPLPIYHGTVRSFGSVLGVGAQIGAGITSLDEYIDVCRRIFVRYKERGAIGMKDQSAYGRTLNFENATRADAERLFNAMMDEPRSTLDWPQAKPLDDFLFHTFMRFARDLDMPVQLHTGHMAGTRNEISKTNAVRLTNVLELHRDVQFDIFHANWPYSGELLFLGKNYPNVALNFCWTNIIDPIYSQDVLAQAVTAVPHGKIFGFGGDYGGVEYAAGHLDISRDNIAWALARHVDSGWLGHDEAKQIAADWLFNNPNRFWKLGFDDVSA